MPATIHVKNFTCDIGGTAQQKQQRLFDLRFVCLAFQRNIFDLGASATANDFVNAARAALRTV